MAGDGARVAASESADPTDGRRVVVATRRVIAYAAVTGPLVTGLAAAAGLGAGLINETLSWPVQVGSALFLLILFGVVARRVLAWLSR